MTEKHFTVAQALNAIKQKNDIYDVLLAHGSLELGMYTPKDQDGQSPHDQDEVYIIQKGKGAFVLDDERFNVSVGDALFVPAGTMHRFENFSEDFAAWVIFYGPSGGEKG